MRCRTREHHEQGHGEEHQHAFELVEVLRVLFVALAAAEQSGFICGSHSIRSVSLDWQRR